MSWRLAESLKKLREQINAAYPNRDKASDGALGDAAHSARKSDHNPWIKDKNGTGVVTAIDIDRDFNDGHDGRELVAALQKGRDRRIKYIIFERQITVKGDVSRWKPYKGANAHNHHIHISVSSDPALYDNRDAWILDARMPLQPVSVPTPAQVRDLKIGDKGDDVKALQVKLGITADGIFGLKTKKAVLNIQVKNGLRADGIVGTNTRKALGL